MPKKRPHDQRTESSLFRRVVRAVFAAVNLVTALAIFVSLVIMEMEGAILVPAVLIIFVAPVAFAIFLAADGQIDFTLRSIGKSILLDFLGSFVEILFFAVIFPLILLEAISALIWVLIIVLLAVVGHGALAAVGWLEHTREFDSTTLVVLLVLSASQSLILLINYRLKPPDESVFRWLRRVEESLLDQIRH